MHMIPDLLNQILEVKASKFCFKGPFSAFCDAH